MLVQMHFIENTTLECMQKYPKSTRIPLVYEKNPNQRAFHFSFMKRDFPYMQLFLFFQNACATVFSLDGKRWLQSWIFFYTHYILSLKKLDMLWSVSTKEPSKIIIFPFFDWDAKKWSDTRNHIVIYNNKNEQWYM